MLSDGQKISSITVTELSRTLCAALARAEEGERLIVTRQGMPIAVITSIGAGIEFAFVGSDHVEVLRREAHEELCAGDTVPLPPWLKRAR